MIIVGPVIALKGKAWFPHVVSTIGGLIAFTFIILASSQLGGMDEPAAIWISLAVASLVGLILAFILRKVIWIAVGLTGVAAGFAVGSFVYGCILATIGWESFWGMIAIAGVCAVVGGFLTFGLGILSECH